MKNNGFTLVEVLIASTILFAVLVTVSVSFQSAKENSQKADTVLRLLQPLPAIQSQIRAELQVGVGRDTQGSGNLLGVHYEWRGNIIKSAPPPAQFQLETNDYLTYRDRFFLYQITLTLTSLNYHREFSYTELAWATLTQQP